MLDKKLKMRPVMYKKLIMSDNVSMSQPSNMDQSTYHDTLIAEITHLKNVIAAIKTKHAFETELFISEINRLNEELKKSENRYDTAHLIAGDD